MARNDKRVKITLECTECKRRNYITMKSKVNDRERLEMKKYCSNDRRHTTDQFARELTCADVFEFEAHDPSVRRSTDARSASVESGTPCAASVHRRLSFASVR